MRHLFVCGLIFGIMNMVPVHAEDWTGLYLGADAGAAIGSISARTTVADNGGYFIATDPAQIADAGSMHFSPAHITGGAHIGYNYQGTGSRFVLGVEGDFNSLDLRSSNSASQVYLTAAPTRFTLTQTVRTDWLLTLRGRTGWAFGNFLLYGTAGAAITRLKYDAMFSDNFSPVFSPVAHTSTRIGWVVGVGGEYRWTEHWSMKGEYLYSDFGLETTYSMPQTINTPFPTLKHASSLTLHLIRLGVNYRFL